MNISQETFNRALLGDETAAKECTDAGYMLNCPECGAVMSQEPSGETAEGAPYYKCGTELCFQVLYDFSGEGEPFCEELAEWNRRQNLHAVAEALYASKWVACKDRMPPNGVCVLCYETTYGMRTVGTHSERDAR